jgi:hypothetical protein
MSECRVHSCIFQQRVVAKKAQPSPLRRCPCRRVVSQVEADQLVKWGEADLLVVAREKKTVSKSCKICDGGDTKTSCSFCEKTGKMLVTDINEVYGRDIVLKAHRTKTNRVSTPRVPTIEAKHILRAYVSNESRAIVAAAARTVTEDEADLDDTGRYSFTPLGYVSPAQKEQAQQRIDEYGLMVLEARAKYVSGEEPKSKRIAHKPGTLIVGYENGNPVYNKNWWWEVEGRDADYGRAI